MLGSKVSKSFNLIIDEPDISIVSEIKYFGVYQAAIICTNSRSFEQNIMLFSFTKYKSHVMLKEQKILI